MPVYEFYCPDCHMLFNFLSRRVNPSRQPDCPRCGRPELERRPARFAVSRGLGEQEGEDPDDPFANIDDEKLERALSQLEREAEGIDEDDPRQAARLFRRLSEATGLPLGEPMQEALRRMEAGEDPDAIEEEFGDALDDPFETEGSRPRRALVDRLRRRLPPRTDDKLYDLP